MKYFLLASVMLQPVLISTMELDSRVMVNIGTQTGSEEIVSSRVKHEPVNKTAKSSETSFISGMAGFSADIIKIITMVEVVCGLIDSTASRLVKTINNINNQVKNLPVAAPQNLESKVIEPKVKELVEIITPIITPKVPEIAPVQIPVTLAATFSNKFSYLGNSLINNIKAHPYLAAGATGVVATGLLYKYCDSFKKKCDSGISSARSFASKLWNRK